MEPARYPTSTALGLVAVGAFTKWMDAAPARAYAIYFVNHGLSVDEAVERTMKMLRFSKIWGMCYFWAVAIAGFLLLGFPAAVLYWPHWRWGWPLAIDPDPLWTDPTEPLE